MIYFKLQVLIPFFSKLFIITPFPVLLDLCLAFFFPFLLILIKLIKIFHSLLFTETHNG